MRTKSALISAFLLASSCAIRTAAAQELTASDPVSLLDLAESFFATGNTYAGATECLRFLHVAPDHPLIFYANYRIGVAESELANSNQAVRSLQLAIRRAPDEKYRRALRYRLAVQLILDDDTELARLELYQLALVRPDSLIAAQANLLIGLTAAFRHDFEGAVEGFRAAAAHQPDNAAFVETIAEMTAYLESGVAKRRKSPRLAKWSSTFVPGSGQAYAGEWFDGLFALSLNSGTTYLVVRALQQGARRNAFLLIVNLWWRYYKGNRLNAQAGATNANIEHWEHVVGEVVNYVIAAGEYLPDTVDVLSYDAVRDWYARR